MLTKRFLNIPSLIVSNAFQRPTTYKLPLLKKYSKNKFCQIWGKFFFEFFRHMKCLINENILNERPPRREVDPQGRVWRVKIPFLLLRQLRFSFSCMQIGESRYSKTSRFSLFSESKLIVTAISACMFLLFFAKSRLYLERMNT